MYTTTPPYVPFRLQNVLFSLLCLSFMDPQLFWETWINVVFLEKSHKVQLHTKIALGHLTLKMRNSSRGGNLISLFDRMMIDSVIIFSISWFYAFILCFCCWYFAPFPLSWFSVKRCYKAKKTSHEGMHFYIIACITWLFELELSFSEIFWNNVNCLNMLKYKYMSSIYIIMGKGMGRGKWGGRGREGKRKVKGEEKESKRKRNEKGGKGKG